MKLFFTLLAIAQDAGLVFLFVRGLIVMQRRKEEERLVALHPILLWIGIVFGGIFSIPVTLFTPADTDGVWYIFELAILAAGAMMYAYCSTEVSYDASGFTATDFFGRKRSFRYEDITDFAYTGQDVILHCGKEKVRLDDMAAGKEYFLAYADQMYRKRKHCHIPTAVVSGKDPMNGNLNEPWLYFFVYLLIFVGCVGMFIMVCYLIRPADDRLPRDAAELRTSFLSCQYKKKGSGKLVLQSPDYEKPFVLKWLEGYEVPVPDAGTLCSGEVFFVTVHEGRYEYSIEALSDSRQHTIISALDENTAYRNTQFPGFLLFLPMFLCGMLFSVFGILVGRHPERYSPRFRRLFYRDDVWRITASIRKW